MVVPSVITSRLKRSDSSISIISEASSPTTPSGGTVVNLTKRPRVLSVPSLAEEGNQRQKKRRRITRSTKKAQTTKMTQATTTNTTKTTFATTTCKAARTQASFGVSIAENESHINLTRPTFDELSTELCKIVDTVHYSRQEAITTLTNLCQWGYTDDPVFLEELLELGGIQRVLLYLKNNLEDPVCVAMAAKAMMACTVRDPKNKSFENAENVVRALTKRNAIEILLQASESYDGGSMKSQVEALRWIWSALLNITDKASAYETGDPEERNERHLAIFNAGINILAKLAEIAGAQNIIETEEASQAKSTEHQLVYTSSGGHFEPFIGYGGADYQLKAVQWIFSSLCGGGGLRKRSAMETMIPARKRKIVRSVLPGEKKNSRFQAAENNSLLASQVMGLVFATWVNITNHDPQDREDFQELNLLSRCVQSLKGSEDQGWISNKDLLIQASQFFVQCCDKKILSTKEDCQLVLPLVVDCIANFPESSYQGGLFDFVQEAQLMVDRSIILESGVLRAIATALESKDLDDDIKDASRQLLRDIVQDVK